MKINEDKGKSPAAPVEEGVDTRLGSALSGSLSRLRRGEHADAEIMAMALEGNLDSGARDMLLKHIAMCDECCEIWMLAEELHREEAQELERGAVFAAEREGGSRRRFYFRYMALAASVVVAVISVYVFFTAHPGQGKLEAPVAVEAPMDNVELAREAPAVKDSAQPGDGGEARSNKMKRGGLKGADLEKASGGPAPDAEKLRKTDGFSSRKSLLTKAPPVAGKKGGSTEPGDGGGDQDKTQVQEQKTGGAAVESKTRLTGRPELPAAQMAATAVTDARERKKTDQEEQGKGADGSEPAKVKREGEAEASADEVKQQNELFFRKDRAQSFETAQNIALPPSPAAGGPRGQQRAVSLNQQAVQSRQAYLPERELRNFYTGSFRLVQDMSRELAALARKGASTEQNAEMAAYIREIQPMMAAAEVSASGRVWVLPDLGWFWGRSRPGSVDQSFYRLAMQGWSNEEGYFFRFLEGSGGAAGKWEARGPEESLADVDTAALLASWKKLAPDLPAAYRSIAGFTAKRLEKAVK